MRQIYRYALTAVTTVSFVAGCSGYQPTTAPSGASGAAAQVRNAANYRRMVGAGGALSVLPAGFRASSRPAIGMKSFAGGAAGAQQHLAVAQFGGTSVLWFLLNDKSNVPPVTCQPASSTNGIAVDRYGNLWIPDGRANTTTEYAPNCGSAKLTIADPTGEPADITFQGKNHVYILNLNSTSGPVSVQGYNATTGKKFVTLTDPSFHDLFGVGTDRLGNVFVSNLTSANVGNVVEFPKGKMPGVQLTGPALALPGAPTFDASNNLIITDWSHLTIDVFAPPYKGSPTTAPLQGASIWCKLNRLGTRLYCGDADFGAIDVYAYPKNGYLYSYTAGLSPSALVTGVAPVPAAAYGP